VLHSSEKFKRKTVHFICDQIVLIRCKARVS
jgi:hypothetical protein